PGHHPLWPFGHGLCPDAPYLGCRRHASGHGPFDCGEHGRSGQDPNALSAKMDKLSTVERALEQIRLEEGEGFQMYREKILDRYRDDQRETTSLAIKILSVAGGLLATLAFAGFLGVLDL